MPSFRWKPSISLKRISHLWQKNKRKKRRTDLPEQLIDGLIGVGVERVGDSFGADTVDFVDKDDAGAPRLGLVEQIPHSTRALAHQHFVEFGAGRVEEWYLYIPVRFNKTRRDYCRNSCLSVRKSSDLRENKAFHPMIVETDR